MSAAGDEDRSRTRAVLGAVLFVALGGAVLLRHPSSPEAQLDPKANDRAVYELKGDTEELGRFLDAPVGFELSPMATAASLVRTADPLVDANRWLDALPTPGLAVLPGATTASGSSFVLVRLWRGQFGFLDDDGGPFHLGRACSQVTVQALPSNPTRAFVTSETIECPPDAPMPVRPGG